MKLSVWQKDMNVIADFAKATRLPDAVVFGDRAALHRRDGAAIRLEDTGAVCAVIEKMANYRRRKGSGAGSGGPKAR